LERHENVKSSGFQMESLPWLPRVSDDFRDRCATLANRGVSEIGPELQALSTQFLDLNDLTRLAKAKTALDVAAIPFGLTRFRLGLVSNGTTSLLEPCLVASALRFGIDLEVVAADFGQSVLEAVNPSSRINQAAPDGILVALDHRGLGFAKEPQQVQASSFDHGEALEQIRALRDGFHRGCGAPCIFQTLPGPPGLVFGSLDTRVSRSLRKEIERFNESLVAELGDSADLILDVAWLASTVGLEHWYDERQWYWARLAFSQSLLPLYADFVCRLVAAVRGKSRKCLVLDLDNTIWGGVVGDDGVEQLSLSEGDPRGEAYRAVQRMALQLKSRGIPLAVCSKNEEGIAREPFRARPDMLLREEDISAFVANWNDKATNLVAIADMLKIGLDSLVLVDDHPAERALVRRMLPSVAVPEIGSDPSLFVQIVLSAGYFEAVTFSNEDRSRAEQYRSNVKREELRASAHDLEGFLRSLDMTIEFAPFDQKGRKRITQLINKTNQFNVTTRRYTEPEVQAMESHPDLFTLQVSLRDRFGDNGMISVVICRARGDAWEIDTWLMSCRVLNRRVERCVCNRLIEAARERAITEIRGVYIPTAKNGIVQDLFETLGFRKFSNSGEGQVWQLDTRDFAAFDVPMGVVD
jgi:FkbH-like protein